MPWQIVICNHTGSSHLLYRKNRNSTMHSNRNAENTFYHFYTPIVPTEQKVYRSASKQEVARSLAGMFFKALHLDKK